MAQVTQLTAQSFKIQKYGEPTTVYRIYPSSDFSVSYNPPQVQGSTPGQRSTKIELSRAFTVSEGGIHLVLSDNQGNPIIFQRSDTNPIAFVVHYLLPPFDFIQENSDWVSLCASNSDSSKVYSVSVSRQNIGIYKEVAKFTPNGETIFFSQTVSIPTSKWVAGRIGFLFKQTQIAVHYSPLITYDSLPANPSFSPINPSNFSIVVSDTEIPSFYCFILSGISQTCKRAVGYIDYFFYEIYS